MPIAFIRSDEDNPTKHYADLYAMIILLKSNVAILTTFYDRVVCWRSCFVLGRNMRTGKASNVAGYTSYPFTGIEYAGSSRRCHF